jgi:hypothetical protein
MWQKNYLILNFRLITKNQTNLSHALLSQMMAIRCTQEFVKKIKFQKILNIVKYVTCNRKNL